MIKMSSKMTDKPTYNKLLSRSGGPCGIIIVQQHMLTTDRNGVPKYNIDRSSNAHAFYNANVSVCNGRDSIGEERAIIENEYPVPEGEAG